MRTAVLLALILTTTPVAAAVIGAQEIVVTASRREAKDYDEHVPAIGLRRVADFAVQEVVIEGDTRDPDKRHDEIYAMVRGAIELAARRGGVELASGEIVVEPLTPANYRSLSLERDSRPDSERTRFLIKTRLGAGADARAALERITTFIKAVPTVGRAQIRIEGDLTLSVVNPDQYRTAVIDLVAADAKATAARLGPDYAVEVKGLDRPIEWSRASLAEVLLYVPYSYAVVPRR